MKEVLFAGFDVSTQSCKLVIIDPAAGSVLNTFIINYDRDLPQYGTQDGVIPGQGAGVSESEPLMWVAAVEMALQQLQNSQIPQEQIACISVSGQQHGVVALDAAGRLSRPRSKLWNDFSTAPECALLTEAVGGIEAMIKEVGNTQRTGYSAAKILHILRHEPSVYRKTAVFLLVHNYINWFLTGGIAAMEPGDVSGMALWNLKTGRWSQKVLAAISPDLAAKLPSVKPSDRSIGTVSDALVERFGLSPHCLIDAGCGDNMYGAVGTGNIKPGVATISLGTSGTAYTCLPEPFVDPLGEIAAYCDSTGGYMPLLCVSNLANGYNRFLEQEQISHSDFEFLVQQSQPGNQGRLLIPWFTGERTPDLPHAAPLYFGFSLTDFTPRIMARALLEGHVLNLWAGFQRMPISPREIRLTGGLSRSSAWCQAIADIFGTDTVPVSGEGAALGAAIHAAWVWNKENRRPVSLQDLAAVFVQLEESERRSPIPDSQKVYTAQKRLFNSLSSRLRNKGGEDPFTLRKKLDDRSGS